MRWFSRRQSLDLGKYVAPVDGPQPSIEDLIDEAMLIAAAGVRIAVKNQIILRSARDHSDYDPAYYRAAVRVELESIAAEKDDDAQRIADDSVSARSKRGQASHQSDYRYIDAGRLFRRERVSRGLAERLRALSSDDEYIEQVVAVSLASALDEIAASVVEKLLQADRPIDHTYLAERDERIRLVLEDLADLEPID